MKKEEYFPSPVGGIRLKMKKISFKEFRRMHPLRGKYVSFWMPGSGYWKVSRGRSKEARANQIKMILRDSFNVTKRTFLGRFTMIGLYVYNELLRAKDEGAFDPLEKSWLNAIDRLLSHRLTDEELHRIIESSSHFTLEPKKGEKISMIKGKVYDLFWFWLFYVYTGRVKIKRCAAEDCERIFSPSRSGNGKTSQIYCSDVCRSRIAQRNIRAVAKSA